MDLQKFMLFIPYEIDDIITKNEDDVHYKILDIQHTYSANQKTIIDVSLVLLNLNTNKELKLPYKDYNWRMVKQNDE